MSIKSALGLEPTKKIRYGVVALGDIAQASFMPGVKPTGNSVITALVTGDPQKAKEVAKEYDVPADAVYDYAGFDRLLTSGQVDAVYIATPNWEHERYTIPALKAGVHVLLEKPIEVSTDKTQAILDAAKTSKAKLMVAYRLHFEPANLATIDTLRSGDIGTLRSFASTFSQPLDPENHRAKNGLLAGPLLDMGPYPINAVRNLFEAEPIEVFALGTRNADAGLPMDFDHTVSAVLKFPGERVATFVVSYIGAAVDEFTVVGSTGSVRLSPAYGFGKPKELTRIIDKKEKAETFKPTDHFGGEVKYFSDCILNNTDPEPDGEEGYLDVRVVEAIIHSLASGQPVKLEPRTRAKRIDTKQVQTLAVPTPPKEVHAANPAKK